ncbi:MAG: hypothetical protein WD534_15125 [Phycisphaeraceae bacterium]
MPNATPILVLFGTGGASPSIWRMSEPSLSDLMPLELPLKRGESVYALDLARDGNRFALGTRRGKVYVVPVEGEGDTASCKPMILDVGQPVLDVRFVGEHLITADVSGRVLAWSLRKDRETPRLLVRRRQAICSLACWDAGKLAALTTAGELLLWTTSLHDEPSRVQAPKPPTPAAATPLLWWTASASLVFPAASGELVCLDVQNHTLRRWIAHAQGFTALEVVGDQLVTVGRTDGRVRWWRGSTRNPTTELTAPHDVVAMVHAPVEQSPPPLVLIDSTGKAMLTQRQGEALAVQQVLPGEAYRVVTRTAPEAMAWQRCQQRKVEAQELATRIRQLGPEGDEEQLRRCYQRLEAVGYIQMALGLQAELASRGGDVFGQVAALHELRQRLPASCPLPNLFAGFTAMLTSLGQFELAQEVRARLPADKEPPTAADLQALIAAAAEGRTVQASHHSMELMARVARHLDRPLQGRNVLAAAPQQLVAGCDLDAAGVADRYIARCSTLSATSAPSVQADHLTWIDEHNRPTTQAFVSVPLHACAPGIELMLRFAPNGAGTFVHHLVAQRMVGDPTATDAMTCDHDQLASHWRGPTGQLLDEALRRAVTHAIRQQRRIDPWGRNGG